MSGHSLKVSMGTLKDGLGIREGMLTKMVEKDGLITGWTE